LRRHLSILFLVCLSLGLGGCATTEDLARVHSDMNRQVQVTNDKIADVEQGTAGLKEEIAQLRGEFAKADEALKPLRGSQAESRADITDIREQLQHLRGAIDGLKKDLASAAVKTNRREDEDKILREKLENLTFKVNFIENFIGIGKKDESAEAAPEKNGKPPAATSKDAAGKGAAKTDKESLYAAAYELFKVGKYEKSRDAFENFLKQYPETEFSGNAQFWIGECYYFEKKYEKAIVEYDKVIKNFPEGNKAPSALLKQGFSFQKLGDNASAKLLLQQVIKDFPNTSQARMARSKLLEIK
jgi:tol-pal system protein YbgF